MKGRNNTRAVKSLRVVIFKDTKCRVVSHKKKLTTISDVIVFSIWVIVLYAICSVIDYDILVLCCNMQQYARWLSLKAEVVRFNRFTIQNLSAFLYAICCFIKTIGHSFLNHCWLRCVTPYRIARPQYDKATNLSAFIEIKPYYHSDGIKHLVKISLFLFKGFSYADGFIIYSGILIIQI